MSVKCVLTNQLNDKLVNGSILSIEQGGTGAADIKTALNNLNGLSKTTVYYPESSGTDLIDTILDGIFLISTSSTNNANLHNIIQDTFVYIIQIFYNNTNRMQLAVGYTNGKIASRTNKNDVWSNWIAAVSASQPMTFSVNASGGLTVTY